MNYTLILAIIFVVTALLLFLKFVKSLVQVFIYGGLLIIICSAVFSYLLFNDAKVFTREFSSGENLFVLKEDSGIIAAFSMKGINLSTVEFMEKADIQEYSSLYKKGDYKSILGDYYKLLIFDTESFPQVENIDAALNFIRESQGGKDMLDSFTIPIGEPRAITFFLLAGYSLKHDPGYILKGYREGKITLYPETITFRMLRLSLRGK